MKVAGNARGAVAILVRMPELRIVSARMRRRTFGRLLNDDFNIVVRGISAA
jgi:hypothetical protein